MRTPPFWIILARGQATKIAQQDLLQAAPQPEIDGGCHCARRDPEARSGIVKQLWEQP
jgi:hypothetical protein